MKNIHLIALCFLMVTCSNEIETEVKEIENYKIDNFLFPKAEVTFIKGTEVKHGPFKGYAPNGQLSVEMEFNNDLVVGNQKTYDTLGNKVFEYNYKYPPFSHEDSLDLYLIEPENDGVGEFFKPIAVFRGIKKGRQINFYSSGQIREERFFNEKGQELWLKEFDEAGVLINHEEYDVDDFEPSRSIINK